ncbi:DUF6262 family protein [Streptacidiphilus sp. MAP5-3]|uniref:DUF6262 family protein n=1 Tax=unclassified Streptacidiphilus TaxID=2643834 RepID=UPI0035192CA2
MTPPDTAQTGAAIAARRRASEDLVERVRTALASMRRDRTPITVAALARTAQVSRTFLYQNHQAKALIEQAAAAAGNQQRTRSSTTSDATQSAWKERALNAEDGLTAAQAEIRIQRTRIAELLGKIRDLEHDLPEGSLQRIVAENGSLKLQVHQLVQDQQRAHERLASARESNRFLDRRVADLEAQLASYLINQHRPSL